MARRRKKNRHRRRYDPLSFITKLSYAQKKTNRYADPNQTELFDYTSESELKKYRDLQYAKKQAKLAPNTPDMTKKASIVAQALQKAKICLNRKIRRESIFASKKAGKGVKRNKPIFTDKSKERC